MHAERRWVDSFQPDEKAAKKLLERGVTSALTIRRDGIFRGRAAVVSLGDGDAGELVLVADGPHGLAFDKGSSRQAYPGSLMGAIALVRQTLLDADWWPRAEAAWRRDSSQARPEVDAAVAALAADLHGRAKPPAIFFESEGDASLLRAAALGREMELPLVHVARGLTGSRLDEVAALRAPLVVPLSLPETPDVASVEAERDVTLAELRAWERAPGLAAELERRGVVWAFTGTGLRDGEEPLDALRARVRRGLAPERALAALTTAPARLAGVETQVGSLERGRRADLVIADGDLLALGPKPGQIVATWVAGRPAAELEPLDGADLRGRWALSVRGRPLELELTGKRRAKLEGKLALPKAPSAPPEPADPANPPADPADPADQIPPAEGTGAKSAKLTGVETTRDRVTFSADLAKVGGAGFARFVLRRTGEGAAAEIAHADGSVERVSLARLGDAEPKPDEKPAEDATVAARRTFPDGPFGFVERPRAEEVLIRGATIWSLGAEGKIEGGDLHVRGGKVIAVGRGLAAPAGARVIDGAGLHVTPGIIDEHSHLAIDARRQRGQPRRSLPRCGSADVIDPDDVGIYRALAGGMTAAQLLHGSANPIGGQAQVVKLRWGASRRGDEARGRAADDQVRAGRERQAVELGRAGRRATRRPAWASRR